MSYMLHQRVEELLEANARLREELEMKDDYIGWLERRVEELEGKRDDETDH